MSLLPEFNGCFNYKGLTAYKFRIYTHCPETNTRNWLTRHVVLTAENYHEAISILKTFPNFDEIITEDVTPFTQEIKEAVESGVKFLVKLFYLNDKTIEVIKY